MRSSSPSRFPAPPLIGFIAEASSLRASFLFIAVLSFLIAVFAFLGRRQERRDV